MTPFELIILMNLNRKTINLQTTFLLESFILIKSFICFYTGWYPFTKQCSINIRASFCNRITILYKAVQAGLFVLCSKISAYLGKWRLKSLLCYFYFYYVFFYCYIRVYSALKSRYEKTHPNIICWVETLSKYFKHYLTIASFEPSKIENVFISCKTKNKSFCLIGYFNYEFANIW